MLPQKTKIIVLAVVFLAFCIPLGHSATLREMYEAAVTLYEKGEYDKAIEIYQEITKQVPQFAPAYIGLGLTLKAKGADIEEVVYYYKMAVDKDPANVQALEQLGRLYYSIGQMEKARDVFERALKITPNSPSIEQSLGWIYLVGKTSSPGRAIKHFQNVIKFMPSGNAYFGLGIAYFSDNQRERAMDMITQLKAMEENDYANRLEKAMRENRKVVLDVPSDASEEGVEPGGPGSDFEKTSDQPLGMKVRLRGKLDDLPQAQP